MSDPKSSETRAVLLDLIEKAKKVEQPGPWSVDYDIRPDGADQVVYQNADGRILTLCFMTSPCEDHESHDAEFIAACSPDALLPLLALALKGLDAEAQK